MCDNKVYVCMRVLAIILAPTYAHSHYLRTTQIIAPSYSHPNHHTIISFKLSTHNPNYHTIILSPNHHTLMHIPGIYAKQPKSSNYHTHTQITTLSCTFKLSTMHNPNHCSIMHIQVINAQPKSSHHNTHTQITTLSRTFQLSTHNPHHHTIILPSKSSHYHNHHTLTHIPVIYAHNPSLHTRHPLGDSFQVRRSRQVSV